MDLSNLEKSVSDKYWAFRGLSAEDVASMQSVLVQLNQALSSGCLRGEEFNTIVEQSPDFLYSIAKQIGGVNVGELRAMANRGMLTADVVVKALRLIFEASAFQVAAKNTKVYLAITQNSCDGGHEVRGVFNTKAQAAGAMIVAVNAMVERAESQGHDADYYFHDQCCSVHEADFGTVLVKDEAIRNEVVNNWGKGTDEFLRELRAIVAEDGK